MNLLSYPDAYQIV